MLHRNVHSAPQSFGYLNLFPLGCSLAAESRSVRDRRNRFLYFLYIRGADKMHPEPDAGLQKQFMCSAYRSTPQWISASP